MRVNVNKRPDAPEHNHWISFQLNWNDALDLYEGMYKLGETDSALLRRVLDDNETLAFVYNRVARFLGKVEY